MAETNPWLLVIAGAVPAAITVVGALWGKAWDRNSKRDETTISREEQIMRNLETQRAGAAREATELIANLRTQIDRLDAEVVRKDTRLESASQERDRLEAALDRWSDYAREWKRRAHEVKHRLANAQAGLGWLLQKSGRPVPVWPNENLPSLEDIVAANSVYFGNGAPTLRIDLDSPAAAPAPMIGEPE